MRASVSCGQPSQQKPPASPGFALACWAIRPSSASRNVGRSPATLCSAPSGSRTCGTTNAAAGCSPRKSARASRAPGPNTTSGLEMTTVDPRERSRPWLFACASPRLVGLATTCAHGCRSRTASTVPSPDALSTTTTSSGDRGGAATRASRHSRTASRDRQVTSTSEMPIRSGGEASGTAAAAFAPGEESGSTPSPPARAARCARRYTGTPARTVPSFTNARSATSGATSIRRRPPRRFAK